MLKRPDISVDDLIAEAAKRHNILLGPDEPYFVMLTLNELVVSRYVAFLLNQIEAARGQATLDRAEQLEAAKKLGESLVTAAADYVAKQRRASVEELTEALTRAASAERARRSGCQRCAPGAMLERDRHGGGRRHPARRSARRLAVARSARRVPSLPTHQKRLSGTRQSLPR